MADLVIAETLIDIELAYHDQAGRPCLQALKLPLGVNLKTALLHLQQIGMFESLGLHNVASLEGRLGIFGKIVPLNTVLHSGDRIEMYRDLVIDPKEARRGRARLKAKALREIWLAKKRAKKARSLNSLGPSAEDVHL